METQGVAAAGSLQANKDLVVRFLHEIFEKGNLEALDEFVSARGLAGVLRHDVPQMQATLANIRIEIGQMVAEADRVALDFTMFGTPRAEALPTTPAVDTVVVANMCIFTIDGGKIARASVLADRLGLFQQLGIGEVPPLAPCPADAV